MKSKKQPALVCPIDALGASARPMAAFSGFYESRGPSPSVDACGIVPPHHDGHQNGHQSGYILHRCFVCYRPGGRRGDTKPVVAQWQRPLASGKLGCAFWFLFPFRTGLIFWNPPDSTDSIGFRGTHGGIKSFQGQIKSSGIRRNSEPESGGKDLIGTYLQVYRKDP